MLRARSLIPLSRQHQHGLALCVRIDRALPISEDKLAIWQTEVAQQFQQEIRIHFAAEELVIFPAARQFSELASLVEALVSEHAVLRADFARAEAGVMSAADLSTFAQRFSAHIRKEERQLFERLQELMEPAALSAIGVKLEDALQDATQTCSLPNLPPGTR